MALLLFAVLWLGRNTILKAYVLLSAGASTSTAEATFPAPWQAWAYQQRIDLDPTQVTGGPHPDFPAVVVRTGDLTLQGNASLDGRDIVFVDSDQTTQLPHEIIDWDMRLEAGAAWTWFNHPRAVYDAASNSTFVGWADTAGNIKAGQYKHGPKTWTVKTLATGLVMEDHDNPSVLVRQDGKIQFFYKNGYPDYNIHYQVSANAGDISGGFAGEQLLNVGEFVGYPNPMWLSGVGKYYLFYQSSNSSGPSTIRYQYYTSTDGDTWTGPYSFLSGSATATWMYMHIVPNGADRVDFVTTDSHPQVGGNTTLYHGYYVPSLNTAYKSDGTPIGTPFPITNTNLTLITNTSPSKSWMWSLATNGGNPWLLFVKFVSTTDHRYMFTRWDGSAWTNPVQIAAGGKYIFVESPAGGADQPYYSGGMSFDQADPTNVYASVETSTDTWKIQRYTTADSGATWTLAETLPARSAKNFRPVVPWNAGPELKVLWLSGGYHHYNVFGSDLMAYPPVLSPNRRLTAAVKIPSLSQGVAKSIYMYYGNPASASQSSSSAVWDANFMGVYYGREVSGDGTQLLDSTMNARHLLKPNGTTQQTSQQQIGKNGFGQFFNLTNYVSEASRLYNFKNLAAFEIESWLKYDGPQSKVQTIFDSSLLPNGADVVFRSSANADTLEGYAWVDLQGQTTQIGATGTLKLIKGWNLVALQKRTDGLYLWINGNYEKIVNNSNNMANADTNYLAIGTDAYSGSLPLVRGVLEELRISNVQRSDGWRVTTFNNYNAPGTFWTDGPLVQAGSPTPTPTPTPTSTPTPTVTPSPTPLANVQAFWKFDEGTGQLAFDYSGYNNHGYLVNNPVWTTGKFDGALDFDGSSNYVNAPAVNVSPTTITAWFKATSQATSQGVIFGQSNGDPPNSPSAYIPVFWLLADGRLRAELFTGSEGAIYSTQNVADNNWHLAAITGTSAEQSFYLDGQFVGTRSGALSQSWWTNTQIGAGFPGFREGAPNTWYYFKGAIDDVRIYNKVLTGDEIQNLYQSANPSPTLSLTASALNIYAGQSSTLSWTSANTTSCAAQDGWTNSTSTSGSQIVTPAVTTTYTMTCIGAGGSVSQSITITVTNPAPLGASASAIPTSGTAPLSVAFSVSVTGGVAPYTFSWDFGDWGTDTIQNPTHTYVSSGIFISKVTVTDALYQTVQSTVRINVRKPRGSK